MAIVAMPPPALWSEVTYRSNSLRVKDRALFVLSQSRSARARALIAGIAKGNANPDLVCKAGMIDHYPYGCIYPDITKRVVFRKEGECTVTPPFAVLVWNHSIVHNQILRIG